MGLVAHLDFKSSVAQVTLALGEFDSHTFPPKNFSPTLTKMWLMVSVFFIHFHRCLLPFPGGGLDARIFFKFNCRILYFFSE